MIKPSAPAKTAATTTDDFAVVIISDTHLGMRNGAPDLLCEFLHHVRCDRLILNGDIIDGWRINHRPPQQFPEAQARVLDAINRKIAEGVEVIYIPGNHDAELRRMGLFGKKVLGIQFEKSLDFIDPKGRRMLIMHGDQLGSMPGIAKGLPKWLDRAIYDYSYVGMTRISAAFDRVAHMVMKCHLGLVSRTRRMIENFNGDKAAREDMAINHAKKLGGYDGIICGHFHAEENRLSKDGIMYLNSGDWVENYTALTMNHQGDWNVLKWGKERHAAGIKRAFRKAAKDNPDKEFRPATEKLIAHIHRIWPGEKPRAPKP